MSKAFPITGVLVLLEREKMDITGIQIQIENLKLTDLIDLEELQKLQDCFALSNNIASIILDPEGRPITRSSNFS